MNAFALIAAAALAVGHQAGPPPVLEIAIVDLGTGALLPVREAGPVGLLVPD